MNNFERFQQHNLQECDKGFNKETIPSMKGLIYSNSNFWFAKVNLYKTLCTVSLALTYFISRRDYHTPKEDDLNENGQKFQNMILDKDHHSHYFLTMVMLLLQTFLRIALRKI